MAILQIHTVPSDQLRSKTKAVENIELIQDLIDDMLETMYSTSNGIGLAAPQVGRKESVVVIDISKDRTNPLILINPILGNGTSAVTGEEGCLSIPDYYADVQRFSMIDVQAMDRNGHPFNLTAEGFLAVVIQHEVDHLKGKLFIDHLRPIKKQMAIRKILKLKRISA
nr:peptide deformylase [uncultured Holophaga sp.]